ncbi:MAG: CAP domain-containing protein [Actinomycetes bacterium]
MARQPQHRRAVAVAVPAPRRTTAATAVVLLVAALLTAAGVALAPPAGASAGTFVSLINSARASAGLPALSSRGDLASVAASWTQRMASSGTLAHNPSLASQVTGYRYVGENVGYGPDAATIHRAFMDSASHRANILDRDYTEVGVAVVQADGRLWVTEVFRAPSGAPKAGTPSPGGGTSSEAATTRSRGSAGAPARAAAPPPPPPPSPEELLRQRAARAVAGPGAEPARDPVQQALRFVEVLRATRG